MSKEYTAISIKQPWANMIALGYKTIETRKWKTNYRGPLLICASKTVDHRAAMTAYDLEPERFSRGHFNQPRGVAICLVDLMGCTRTYDCSVLELDELAKKACCEVTPFMCCWHLENVRRLKAPLPQVKGKLSLFNVELERVVFE